jgi:predicted  nucleic acid-binding Zn-ribbon protein
MNADDLKYSQAYVDAQQAEIERLREAVAERDEELRSLRLIIANKDARFQRIREALGDAG